MGTTRKYIFFSNAKGVRTYKVLQDNGGYKLVKHNGQEVFTAGFTAEFWDWFDATTAITIDEEIDFCFLSEGEIQLPELPYMVKEQTTWSKEQISEFCLTCLVSSPNFEIHYAAGKQFVVQGGNIVQANDKAKLYLQCMPTLTIADGATYYGAEPENMCPVAEQVPAPAPQPVATIAHSASPAPNSVPAQPVYNDAKHEAKKESPATRPSAPPYHEVANQGASALPSHRANSPRSTTTGEKQSSRVFESIHPASEYAEPVEPSVCQEQLIPRGAEEENNPLGDYFRSQMNEANENARRHRR